MEVEKRARRTKCPPGKWHAKGDKRNKKDKKRAEKLKATPFVARDYINAAITRLRIITNGYCGKYAFQFPKRTAPSNCVSVAVTEYLYL